MPEHVDIVDPEIHEPKGVAAATIGQVYVADGVGSGTWTSLSVTDLTQAKGSVSLTGNAVETVIAVATTPVLIAGTFALGGSAGLVVTSAGRVTNSTGNTVLVDLKFQGLLDVATGTDTLDLIIHKGDSPVTHPSFAKSVTAGTPVEFTFNWQLSLADTEYVEVYVVNNDTTENITVTDAVFTAY